MLATRSHPIYSAYSYIIKCADFYSRLFRSDFPTVNFIHFPLYNLIPFGSKLPRTFSNNYEDPEYALFVQPHLTPSLLDTNIPFSVPSEQSLYTVKPVYNDVGLNDTLPIQSDNLWYK
jgi:hypothetical protein